MMKKALFLAVMLVVSCPLHGQREKKEQATPAAQRAASDARSFMELFTKLERDWMLAVQHKDRAALDSLLAPEFIERTASDPEHPVSRADWIGRALKDCDLKSFEIRNLVIRSFLENAVVSFEERQQITVGGADRSGRYFIVEVWVGNTGRWQAVVRFSSWIGK
jgi:hypothetical protein